MDLTLVPLTLSVGGVDIIDDETFNQLDFLKRVAECPDCPKSACPSPEAYKDAFGIDDVDAFGITLSAELSGSYNSAALGAQLAKDENPKKNVYVFNSRSASTGQGLIAMKIKECEDKGLTFDQVVEEVEAYIATQQTMFVLESLETLRKNGRLSNLKAAIVNVLNIKPIMVANEEGQILQGPVARGMKKALIKMAEEVGNYAPDQRNRVLAISHCNNYKRALDFKTEILKRYHFKDVTIAETAGVASMYANDGGIIITF